MLQFAAIAHEGDVLVMMSRSGRSQELERTAKFASSRGALVIALTDPGSGLAGAANMVFPTHALDDDNVYTPMSSRLAHLALLDALQVALALAQGETAVVNLRRAKDAIRERHVTADI